MSATLTSREGPRLAWPPRSRPLAALALCMMAVGLVLRLVLWAQFARQAGVSIGELAWILPAGVVDDLVEGLYLLAPFAVYLALLPDRWYRSPANRAILAAGAVLTLAGLVYLAVSEYYFFEEFDARFNLVAVDYLAYPNEVAGDIWAEYPVVRTLVAASALALAVFMLSRHHFVDRQAAPTQLRHRLPFLGAYGVLLGVVALAFQTDSLALSDNRVANELAANGPSSFFRAFRTLELDYRRHYRTLPDEVALKTLADHLGRGGGRFVNLAGGSLEREFAANPDGLGRLNVVVISSESFGAEFSRLYGGDQDLTPYLDRYAGKGIWFSNVYASGTRTVRGLEAISASFPPIPSVAILRRPGNEDIATWGRVMRDNGYRTSFLYGGFGYFDNMNYFFGENGFETVDRADMPAPRFANIWGMSDQDLFANALDYYDRQHAAGQPFFSIIMTTSNHKPYTFPAGVPGVPEEGGGRAAGVRYADYALGEFLANAERHDWFRDTVFVVVADHGARVYGEAAIPMKSYRIPLLIYAPAHLAPRRVDTITSQIDVAPTVLGLLGLPYRAPFFGQDVLSHPEAPRAVLLSHNHDVALYRDGKLVVLGLDRVASTYAYDQVADRYTPLPPDPALEQLAIAYYQTGFDLFRTHRYQ
ncbi:MAG: LTA synthase family protein [Chromatiales bacterium]|nr:LTA synthase family protein [Chromatiales bacterium]